MNLEKLDAITDKVFGYKPKRTRTNYTHLLQMTGPGKYGKKRDIALCTQRAMRLMGTVSQTTCPKCLAIWKKFLEEKR